MKKYQYIILSAIGAFALVPVLVNAQSASVTGEGSVQGTVQGGVPTEWRRGGPRGEGMMKEGIPMMNMGVSGKITSINGTQLTVERMGRKDATTTSVVVEGANAIVFKAMATSSLSQLVVGDNIMAEGTTTGATFVATKISSGMMFKGGPKGDGNTTGTPHGNQGRHYGFFGGIKSFFSNLFHF